MTWTWIAALIAYLIGSVNSSIIVGRLLKNVDIRNYGSGNAGATNTLRTLGVGPAILVIIGDALKGIAAVWIGWILADTIGGLFAGIAVVLGHNWPIFFQFKGGKGILTSAAVVIMTAPREGLIVVLTAIGLIAVTRYVSLGSIVGAVLFPLLVAIMKPSNTPLLTFSIILAVLAVYRHRANIKRLLSGTESKLGSKKSVK